MYAKFKQFKMHDFLWLLIYIFPIFYLVGYILVNCRNGGSFTGFDVYISNINSLIGSLGDTTHNFIYDCIHSIFSNFNGGNFGSIELLLCFYSYWLVVVTLIHLAVDFLLILPNICSSFAEKLGGRE